MNPNFIAQITDDFLVRNGLPYDDELQQKKIKKEKTRHKNLEGLNIMNVKGLVELIDGQLENSDYFGLCISSQPGGGKSTIARSLAHEFHQRNYTLKYSSGFDLAEAPSRFVQGVIGDKVMIILDDASYVLSSMSPKAQSKLKGWMTLIRHNLTQANGGRPVKVLMVIISHWLSAVPPSLRNSSVWLFPKPTTMETDSYVRIIGRSNEGRQALESIFNSVLKVQADANKNKNLMLRAGGQEYPFKWGDKTDPGNGRLVMGIVNGKPLIYQAENVYCNDCAHIGQNVKINQADYQTNRPSEEKEYKKDSKDDAEKRGTQ